MILISLSPFDAEQDDEKAKRKDEEMGLSAAKVFGFLFLGQKHLRLSKRFTVAGVVRNIHHWRYR